MTKQTLQSVFTFLLFCLAHAAFSQVDVLTQHNNLSRTGWNDAETKLTVANVTGSSFGLITSHTVDDQIYAQPLVVSGVDIAGTATNVVYVATVNNTLYAYDAEDGTAPVLWTRNLTSDGYRPPHNGDMTMACGGNYNDFRGVDGLTNYGGMGIVGTPVIDKATNTIYVVHREVDENVIDKGPHATDGDYLPTGFRQYLHAIDIRTGAEKAGSPTLITATALGTGPGNTGNIITFDPRKENQRGGLLLMNGAIYIPYAAHCDWDNYYGWVLAYNAANLQQRAAYITGPNDGRGGVWMSGSAITADPAANGGNGSLYIASGNSGGGDPAVFENRGESIIRLDPNGTGATLNKLAIGDYYTPSNFVFLNDGDLDFGTQTMLLPNTNLLVAGSKDHNVYVFDKANLGKYDPPNDHWLQKLFVNDNAGMHTAFSYFGGSTHKYFYLFSENASLKAFPVNSNSLGNPISGVLDGPDGQAGAVLSTSSNGTNEATGILWVSQAKPGCNANQESCDGILRAVNASNPSKEIWNSAQNAADEVGVFSKNACPTVANGKVYLPSLSNKLNIYGLLASNALCKDNVALNKPATDTSGNTFNAGQAFNGDANSAWQSNVATDWIQVDLGAAYDICKIVLTWFSMNDAGEDFRLQVSNNPAGPWTTIENVTGNTVATSEYSGDYPPSRYVRLKGVTMGVNNDYKLGEMAVLGTIASTCPPPANLNVDPVSQTDATVNWDAVASATSYTIRYKPSGTASWITRTSTTTTQALTELSCGFDYAVNVQAVCPATSSTFAAVTATTNVCTTPCTLPTRYSHTDLGDIGMAGSSCYDGPSGVFTIKGSGNIAGNDDRFQFAYTNLSGNENFIMQVTSQTAQAGGQAGMMMRDSLSNTSKFVYLAMTNGSGAQFSYRTTSGGPVTVIQGPAVAVPYYFQLQKSGTTYTAFTSANGTDWTQLASQNAGFGTKAVYPGLAVTSSSNTSLATATFNKFSESAPLPVTLTSFTGKNVNNQFIRLNWTTAMEEKNDHYLVEHSADGVTFTTLTTVNVSGDSDTLRNYTAVDNTPFNGSNYYRLQQVDIDGRTTTLPTVVVEFGSSLTPSVYPNPATDFVNVEAGSEPIVNAVIYDVTGREVRRKENKDGISKLNISVASLPRGVYLIKTTTATKTYQQKIVKQ